MSSEALRAVGRDYLQKVGRPTLKAVGLALTAGGITFVVAHQGWQASIEIGVLVAIVVAVVVLLSVLALAVGQLDRKRTEASRTVTVLNQKIGAHKAIAAWVKNCEMSLRDEAQKLSRDQLLVRELDLLTHNTLNSLAYPFYSQGLLDHIRALAEGEAKQSVEDRLEALLAFLKKNLEAGAFLV